MRFSFFACAAALVSLFSTNILAKAPSYNFVSASYTQEKVDDVPLVAIDSFFLTPFILEEKDLDLDGFLLEASFELNDKLFVS